jgi:sugar lactone lactonase YvrE
LRSLISTLTATVAVGFLAACAGNAGSPSAALPSTGQGRFVSLTPLQKQAAGHVSPDTSYNLFVADETGNAVTVYDHTLTLLSGQTITGLHGPNSLAFDSSGDVYVSNGSANNVTRYFGTTLNLTISSSAKCPIKDPVAVAVGAAGNIFLANAGNNTVNIYNSDGTCSQVLTSQQGIGKPQALAFDISDNLWVANGGTGSHPLGTVTEYTGFPPNKVLATTVASDMDNPKALVFDSADNLYVASDVNAGTVWEYTAGAYPPLKQWGAGDFSYPNALVFDQLGNLYVSSGGNNKVFGFTPAGAIYKILGLTSKSDIKHPVSLAIGPATDWLSVANDFTPGSVTRYCPAKTCTTPGYKTSNDVQGPVSIGFGP